MIFRTLSTTQTSTQNPELRVLNFVLSTSKRDRHGTVLNQDNWKLENYRKNPIVGYMHHGFKKAGFTDPDPDFIVGKTLSIGIQEGTLQAEAQFEPDEVNPLAGKIYRKLLFGSLGATSVGFMEVGKGRYGQGDQGRGQENETYYFAGQELVEWSIVNIPSNPETGKRSLRDASSSVLQLALKYLGNTCRPSQIEAMKLDQAHTFVEARILGIQSKTNDLQKLKLMIDQAYRQLYVEALKKKQMPSSSELREKALFDLSRAAYLERRGIELSNREMQAKAWALQTEAHRVLNLLKKRLT